MIIMHLIQLAASCLLPFKGEDNQYHSIQLGRSDVELAQLSLHGNK